MKSLSIEIQSITGSLGAEFVRLPTKLAKLDWRGSNAAVIAGQIIRDHLKTLTQPVVNEARAYGLETPLWWCNQIANARPGEVQWFWIPIRGAEKRGELLLGPDQEKILQRMPAPDETVRALLELAWGKPPSTTSSLIHRFAPSQKAALFQSRATEMEATIPSNSSRYVEMLIRNASQTFSSPSRIILSVRRWLDTRESYRGMSLPQFGRLPNCIQAEIAAATEHQQALLSPCAKAEYERIIASARGHGLETVFPRQQDWQAAIKSGDLDNPAVTQGLDYWHPPLRRLHPALATCRDPEQSSRVITWVKSQPLSPELSALSLLASPRLKWCERLSAMDSALRDEVIQLINPKLLINELISAEFSSDVLDWVKPHQTLRKELIKALFSMLPVQQTFFENSSTSTLTAFCSVYARLAGDGLLSDVELSELRARIIKNIGDSSNPNFLLAMTTVQSISQILHVDKKTEVLAARLMDEVRNKWLQDDRFSTHYRRLLQAFPELVLERHTESLRAREVAELMSGKQAGNLLDALCACPYRSKAEGWLRWLRKLEQSSSPLMPAIEAILVKHPEWLRELLETHPRLFGYLAVRELPLTELLTFAFRSRTTGRLLDDRYTRGERLKALSWVKSHYGDRPRLAAACELGLLVGVRFTPFLYHLARSLPLVGVNGRDGYTLSGRYHSYTLPKKSGGCRLITVPDKHLKGLQRALLREGFIPLDQGLHAYGFRGGRSIVDNARVHAGSDIVVNVDIRAFFSNTSFGLIRQVCEKLAGSGLSPLTQWLAAEICSFEAGLPTGAPTSPTIGNLVLERTDQVIAAVCRQHGFRYTRYADDLTFSGSGDVTKVLPFVARLLKELGYVLDSKKTNIFRKGRRQLVTGLVVNEKPNIVRSLRRRLRAAVHHRTSGRTPTWHGNELTDRELLGRIAFLNMTQPLEAERLWAQLASAGVVG